MYTESNKARGAKKLPLNMLDALRAFDKNKVLKAALGQEFADAYLKLKHDEWNRFTAHFSQWERENTLDV